MQMKAVTKREEGIHSRPIDMNARTGIKTNYDAEGNTHMLLLDLQ
jgi:hypothetical protein